MSTEQNVNNPAIRRTPRRHGRIRLLLVVGAVILSAFLFQRAPDLPEITRTALYSLFYSSIGNPTPLFKDVINFLSINSPLILALLVGGMVWVAFVIVSQNLGSWEKRRRVRIAIIFLLLLPFYGALLYISIFWIIPKFSPTTAAALLATLGKKGEITNLLTDYNPVFTAIILMALWWPSTRFARFVHDRYFSQFNSYVLNEIGDLQSAFGRDTRPLKWQVPLRGIRAEAWGELQTFATGAADDQQKPFLWTAFVGRPGSGKTRSALQLAFQLAKRDETGRTQWIPHKHFLYWIWRVFFRKRRSLADRHPGVSGRRRQRAARPRHRRRRLERSAEFWPLPAARPEILYPERLDRRPAAIRRVAADQCPGAGHRPRADPARRQVAGRVPPVGRLRRAAARRVRLHHDKAELAPHRAHHRRRDL